MIVAEEESKELRNEIVGIRFIQMSNFCNKNCNSQCNSCLQNLYKNNVLQIVACTQCFARRHLGRNGFIWRIFGRNRFIQGLFRLK